MSSDEELCIIQTTTGGDDSARALARVLVEGRLAACVQIAPVRSVYLWKGAVEDTVEWLLQIKARRSDWDELREAIRARHPYDVPEIIRLDIAAADAGYLAWALASTQR